MVRTPRCRFLFNRAHYGVPAPVVARLPCHRDDRGGERPLGVHRPSTEEEIAGTTHGELTWRGIEVADEDRVASTTSPGGDQVAHLVHVRVVAHVEQSPHQNAREPALVTAHAVDAEHLREQRNAVDGWTRRRTGRTRDDRSRRCAHLRPPQQ